MNEEGMLQPYRSADAAVFKHEETGVEPVEVYAWFSEVDGVLTVQIDTLTDAPSSIRVMLNEGELFDGFVD